MFLQSGGGAGMLNMILFAGILLVFYFFIIRPQGKQKEQTKFINSLEKGERCGDSKRNYRENK